MKKANKALIILLFFLLCFSIPFSFDIKPYAKARQNITISSYNFEFIYGNKKFYFSTDEFLEYLKISNHQKILFQKNKCRLNLARGLVDMGFLKEEAINYAFPEIKEIIEILKQELEIKEVKESVMVEKNKCRLNFNSGIAGRYLNLEKIYCDILNSDGFDIKIDLQLREFKTKQNIKNDFVEKGCFSTSFYSSGNARKNNIKIALSKFDGLVLDVGEVLSFNQTTGPRTEENGYQSAKIISGGVFVDGFGGGVCQVSTTLYNACLLSGLEILEVHSHSLPVSYVEPSFDAMVNIGSSDLKIKNNTGGKILITTSYENDICKVKIFGQRNDFKITRTSEKIKILKAEEDKVENDYKKYNVFLNVGEEKRLSYSKDGYVSKGYLNFYDRYGNLLKTENIRKDSYAPTKGIILKREN